jgi:hypothetical protein
MPAYLKISRLLGTVIALSLCHGAHAASGLPRYGVLIYSDFCTSAFLP